MKIYLVGGAVRDELLNRPIKERDWVVVGSSPQEMLALGYKQVGKDFPVFLHPETHEEFALARTERKVKPGYHGFNVDFSKEVTLEEDLLRRDLTINAMAKTVDGQIIDPFNGQKDLSSKTLRHVSPAFAEDPVRVLRVARFIARYKGLGFSIASETKVLMAKMVSLGEVNALVAERVWKEFERALSEPYASEFIKTLIEVKAADILFPGIVSHPNGLLSLEKSQGLHANPLIRFSLLMSSLPKDALQAFIGNYRIPKDYAELAMLVNHFYLFFEKVHDASDVLKLFSKSDAYRRFARFELMIQTCEILTGHSLASYLTLVRISKTVPEITVPSNQAGSFVREWRIQQIAQWLSNNKLA